MVGLQGEAAESTFTNSEETDMNRNRHLCTYVLFKKVQVVWCCRFRRGRVGSFRHNPDRPSRHTAAPPSRRWSPCVYGSRLCRAWRSACIAPRLCLHPSGPEHLLDTNRHTWKHNETQRNTINIVLNFHSLISVNLLSDLAKMHHYSEKLLEEQRAFSPHSTNSLSALNLESRWCMSRLVSWPYLRRPCSLLACQTQHLIRPCVIYCRLPSDQTNNTANLKSVLVQQLWRVLWRVGWKKGWKTMNFELTLKPLPPVVRGCAKLPKTGAKRTYKWYHSRYIIRKYTAHNKGLHASGCTHAHLNTYK